jgi:hypothetical protein
MPNPGTRKLLERLFAALDWSRLGAIYCDEGGAAFWAEHRGPALRLGMAWADRLLPRLGAGGVSLYVGAGVAELPAMVAEVREGGRRVFAANMRAGECSVLNEGLRAVGVGPDELTIEAGDARRLAGRGPFDQLALVSVLTDPESWPTVSALTYGRVPPVLLDVEAFVRERAEVLALVEALLDTAAPRTVWTTTVDEVSWLMDAAARRGLRVEADEDVVETAIVGDPLGFLTIVDAAALT